MRPRGLTHQFVGVHHVLLAVPAEQKAEAHHFYEEILGFKPLSVAPEIGGGDNLWWYDCGAAQLHLAVEAGYQAHPRPHPAILVANLDALAGVLSAHGVAVRWDDHYPGLRRFYMRDPFGNRLEFAEPLDR